MRNYQVRSTAEGHVVSLDGKVTATFAPDLNGAMTFQLFLRGVSSFGDITVYDADRGKFLVGSVDQLTADLAQHDTPEAREAAGDFPIA